MEKLILTPFGAPKVFKHKGSGESLLSRKELDEFAAYILAEQYSEGGNTPQMYDKPCDDYPDFAIPYEGRLKKSFVVRSVENLNVQPEFNAEAALALYHEHGTYPRLVLVQLTCLETGSSTKCLAGGNYTARVKYISLAGDNHTDDGYKGERKSQAELAAILCEAWNKRDVSIVAPYISDDVCYESAWVFDMIVGKREYLENLRDRFEYMHKYIYAEIAENPCTHMVHLRMLPNQDGAMLVRTNGGYITSMKMIDDDKYDSAEYAQYNIKGDFI